MKRKAKHSAASRILNRIIALSLTLLFLFAAFGAGVVKLRHQKSQVANSIKILEEEISAEHRELASLGIELSKTMSQDYLMHKNDVFGLKLEKPSYAQIVRVSEEQAETRLLNKSSQGSFTAYLTVYNSPGD